MQQEAEGDPGCRRGGAAELLDQAVVAPPSGQAALLPLGPPDDLEGGPAVVVQPGPGDHRPGIVQLPIERSHGPGHGSPVGLEGGPHAPGLEELAYIEEIRERRGHRVVPRHVLGDELVSDGVLLVDEKHGVEQGPITFLGERLDPGVGVLLADDVVVLERVELGERVNHYPRQLSGGEQQRVAIARALELNAQILILDEPTSSLNVQETERLFNQIRRLRQEGTAIVFITHFLDQVYQISDTITVLRNGEYIGTWPAVELNKFQLIGKLLGKEAEKLSEVTATRITDANGKQNGSKKAIVETRGLSRDGGIKPFDLSVEPGDVLGCAGLLGSGRTEVANLLFGVDHPDDGDLLVEGKKEKVKSPRQALQLGIALSPEDRK